MSEPAEKDEVPAKEDEAPDNNQPDAEGEDSKRVKRKMAIVIGYIGTAYRGLQINYEVEENEGEKKSIECIVRDALIRAGMISQLNARPVEKKVDWSRSSRTDAGVHALRLVIAAKLLLHEDDIDVYGHNSVVVAELNKELPDDVRCFGAVRVPKGFDAKAACSWREYEYLLPTHLVCRAGEDSSTIEPAELARRLESTLKNFEGCHSFHNYCRAKAADFAWKTPAGDDKGKGKGGKGKKGGKAQGKKRKAAELEEDDADGGMAECEDAGGAASDDEKVTPAEAEEPTKAGAAPSSDAGTSGNGEKPTPTWVQVCTRNRDTGEWKERAAEVMKHTQSTIHMVTCQPTHEGKLLRIILRGQFFLYNQIRLMIGSAVAVCVGTITEELLKLALLLQVEMHMPLAPAVGLLLRTAGFTEMDRRAGFCSMDDQQAIDSMMPAEGIILVDRKFASVAQEFEKKVEAEVERQWDQGGQLHSWSDKLKHTLGPSEETFVELRAMAEVARAKDVEFKTSQGAADKRRRDAALTHGSGGFAGVMPRRFAAQMMVRFGILPGRRLTNMQFALALRLRRLHKDPESRPACLSTSWPPETEEILKYVAEVGAETLAEEGAASS